MANLIAAKFLNDKTPPVVGIVDLPATEKARASRSGGRATTIGRHRQLRRPGLGRRRPLHRLAHRQPQRRRDFRARRAQLLVPVRATDGVGNVGRGTSRRPTRPHLRSRQRVRLVAAASSTSASRAPYAPERGDHATNGTVLRIIGGRSPRATAARVPGNGPYAAVNAWCLSSLAPGSRSRTDPRLYSAITPPNSTAVAAGSPTTLSAWRGCCLRARASIGARSSRQNATESMTRCRSRWTDVTPSTTSP